MLRSIGAMTVWCVPGGKHLCHELEVMTVWCVPGGNIFVMYSGP